LTDGHLSAKTHQDTLPTQGLIDTAAQQPYRCRASASEVLSGLMLKLTLNRVIVFPLTRKLRNYEQLVTNA
jgi:hypothetical protein